MRERIRNQKQSGQDAVSPVIGVMLMLVVTIIIAAVVTAFAGGTMGSQTKAPQATIKAIFSQSGGMQIVHTGGDTLPASSIMFSMTSDATFGQGVSAVSAQVIDKSIIHDAKGNWLQKSDGSSLVTSFAPGQTLFIDAGNLGDALQPEFAPMGAIPDEYAQNYANPANIGKTFTLTMGDKASGATIAKTTVVITA